MCSMRRLAACGAAVLMLVASACTGDPRLARLRSGRDQICACKDHRCVLQARSLAEAYEVEAYTAYGLKPGEKLPDEVSAVREGWRACMEKLEALERAHGRAVETLEREAERISLELRLAEKALHDARARGAPDEEVEALERKAREVEARYARAVGRAAAAARP